MLHCSICIAAMQNRPFNSPLERIMYAPSERTTPMEEIMNPIRSFRNWRRYNETVRQLNRLNTRQLADLGINRADIVRVARASV